MKTTKSQFNKWKAGEITMLGSFQTMLFRTFQIADSENQQKLVATFPEWFSGKTDEIEYRGSLSVEDPVIYENEEQAGRLFEEKVSGKEAQFRRRQEISQNDIVTEALDDLYWAIINHATVHTLNDDGIMEKMKNARAILVQVHKII